MVRFFHWPFLSISKPFIVTALLLSDGEREESKSGSHQPYSLRMQTITIVVLLNWKYQKVKKDFKRKNIKQQNCLLVCFFAMISFFITKNCYAVIWPSISYLRLNVIDHAYIFLMYFYKWSLLIGLLVTVIDGIYCSELLLVCQVLIKLKIPISDFFPKSIGVVRPSAYICS